MSQPTHVDGTPCPQGIPCELPENYQPCCESFDYRTRACNYDVRLHWSDYRQQWGLECMDRSSVISINFCPWCGAKVGNPIPKDELPPLAEYLQNRIP